MTTSIHTSPIEALPTGFPKQIKVLDAIDFELLQTLTVRVPLLSKRQAILYLKKLGQVGTEPRDRLEQLRATGWLQHFCCVCSRTTPSTTPKVSWQPGEDTPRFTRFRQIARDQDLIYGPSEIDFYVASRFTANLFGTRYRGTVTNDGVSKWWKWGGVFLGLISDSVELEFQDESKFPLTPTTQGTLPERLASVGNNSPQAISAFLAESSITQLCALHVYCRRLSLPYLLW